MKTFYIYPTKLQRSWKTILLLFLNSLFLAFNSYGQGENNIWYFGYNAGLDFNSGSPVALTNGQTNVYEGTATISDSAGNLLFYSDGMTVWNRNHLPMINGIGLGGNASSTQSATIVPRPGSYTEYYIFNCPAGGSGTFCYSIVDMTLDGGDGDVTLKNIPLHTPSSEKCVAVYKSGSSDIWVIGHDGDTAFYSYLVTSSGINNPVLSFNQLYPYGYDVGYMKASPQGNKIACALYNSFPYHNFVLFDFNCTNGNISNEMIFSISGFGYGLEFSPDGTKLYVIPWPFAPTPVYQYDVTLSTAGAIAASQIIVGYSNYQNIGCAQIGPDQKIYIVINNHNSVSVINDPNMTGTGCNFVDNAIYLGGNTSGIGLPALIRGSVCGTTAINEIPNDLKELQLLPNPSSGIFQITFPSSSNQKTNYTLEVINTLAQTVFRSTLSPPGRDGVGLNLSFLPKGMYVLKIYDSVSALSSKLVIE